MREVAGPFEQPLRPLLPHNDMLESNTPHTDVQDGTSFLWAVLWFRPTAEMNL
jgi:hypothetical protein